MEKQNAEMGQMPVVAEESRRTAIPTRTGISCGRSSGKEKARLTFADGVEVVRMLMAAYQSAEQGKTVAFPPAGLDEFVPKVAKGTWRPR